MSAFKFNITLSIKFIILLLLSSTIIFNLQEYINSFNISLSIGPEMFFKIGKDIGFILIFLLSVIDFCCRKSFPRIVLFFIALLFIVVLLCFKVDNILFSLVGLRWILPVFLVLSIYNFVDDNLLLNITKILYVLLIIHVISQLCQLVFMPPIYGVNFLGLSARDTGIFVYPSPSGLFANTCYVFFSSFRKYKFSTFLVILSILLSMSSSGTFLFLLLFFINSFYNSRYFRVICLLLPLLGLITFQNLDFLTGRNKGDSLSSGTTRVEIFSEQFNSSDLISDKFGMATNTAFSLKLENAFIADSTYTSILANLGIGCFIIYITALLFIGFYLIIRKSKNMIMFYTLFCFGSLSIIIIEFFPINLLYPILITYYLKNNFHNSFQKKGLLNC